MGMGIQSPRIIKTHSQAKGRGERTVRIAQFLLLSSEEKGVSSLTRAEGCSPSQGIISSVIQHVKRYAWLDAYRSAQVHSYNQKSIN